MSDTVLVSLTRAQAEALLRELRETPASLFEAAHGPSMHALDVRDATAALEAATRARRTDA